MRNVIELKMRGGAEIERENATTRHVSREGQPTWIGFGEILEKILRAHVHAASRLEIPGADNAAAPAPP